MFITPSFFNQNITISELLEEKYFKFGGAPISSGSFWKLTAGMAERITKYGIRGEVEKYAKRMGLKNYDIRLAKGVTTRKLTGTNHEAQIVQGANPKQHEIQIAEILERNGYKVLFTPENTFVRGIKNPEGIELTTNKIIEFKNITSTKLDKVIDNFKRAENQGAEIVTLRVPEPVSYKKENAVEVLKSRLKHSNVNMILLIWKGEVIKITK